MSLASQQSSEIRHPCIVVSPQFACIEREREVNKLSESALVVKRLGAGHRRARVPDPAATFGNPIFSFGKMGLPPFEGTRRGKLSKRAEPATVALERGGGVQKYGTHQSGRGVHPTWTNLKAGKWPSGTTEAGTNPGSTTRLGLVLRPHLLVSACFPLRAGGSGRRMRQSTHQIWVHFSKDTFVGVISLKIYKKAQRNVGGLPYFKTHPAVMAKSC